MNLWQKIQSKHSEAYDKWRQYIYTDNSEIWDFFDWQELNLSYLWGHIEDFFDSKGIYIVMDVYQKDEKNKEFIYSINNQGYFGFKSRQEAREAAIIKCFEILERDK